VLAGEVVGPDALERVGGSIRQLTDHRACDHLEFPSAATTQCASEERAIVWRISNVDVLPIVQNWPVSASENPSHGLPKSAIVVGAGFIGSSTAYFLALEGVDVTLIDAECPGWGASGRSAGYVSMISRGSGPQLDLANLTRELYVDLAGELSNFDLRTAGALIYYYEDQVPLIPGFVDQRRSDGLPIETLDGDEARALCPLLPEDVVGAVHSVSDGCIHPGKFVDALVEGMTRHGGRVVQAEVLGLDMRGTRCTGVRTTNGKVDADVVVVTAGAWAEPLLRGAGYPFNLHHIRLHMAETAPIELRFEPQMYGPTLFHEYMFMRDLPEFDDDLVLHPLQRIMPEVGDLEMFVQRADGRLLLGCPIEFVEGPDVPAIPTVAGLAQLFGILGDHVPALQGLPVERVWSGIAPQTSDGLPVMGRVGDAEGLYVGGGHGYGVTVGPGSGRVLADLVLGRPTAIDSEPFKYDRPAVTESSGRAVMY
jgi:glycine/D-amino acid oxidase-like deaminating enzyme